MTSASTMQKKVVLITGATSGIGVETAVGLAKLGATVIIVGRDQKRGSAAAESIRQVSGNSDVEFIAADLASQASVRQLAKTVLESYDRLDVLINNVGASFSTASKTADGIETSFAINYLNPFLLTLLLLPRLQASAPARIVNVSSMSHRLIRTFDFDDLQHEREFLGMYNYGHAKLAKMMFTYELARRLEGTGVTVNAYDPGNAATDGSRSLAADQLPWFMRMMYPLMGLVQSFNSRYATAEKAARGSIYLASSPDVEGVTGKHFNAAQKITPSSKLSYDADAAKRLWDASLALVGEAVPSY